MKTLVALMLTLIALPVGALLGGRVGSAIGAAILQAQGMGHSHNDMFTIVSAQFSAALIGAVLLPPLAWRLEGSTVPDQPPRKLNKKIRISHV